MVSEEDVCKAGRARGAKSIHLCAHRSRGLQRSWGNTKRATSRPESKRRPRSAAHSLIFVRRPLSDQEITGMQGGGTVVSSLCAARAHSLFVWGVFCSPLNPMPFHIPKHCLSLPNMRGWEGPDCVTNRYATCSWVLEMAVDGIQYDGPVGIG
jgi:hypothetical protein